MTKSIRDIIQDAGGEEVVRRRVGVSKSAVRKWADFGIRDRYWDDLIDLSGRDENDNPLLTIKDLHAANRQAREAKAA